MQNIPVSGSVVSACASTSVHKGENMYSYDMTRACRITLCLCVAVNNNAHACLVIYRAYHGTPCSSTVEGRPSDRMSLYGDIDY